MELITPNVQDTAVAKAMFDVAYAAHFVDEPDNPPPCSVAFPVRLRHRSAAAMKEYRAARVDGRLVGYASVSMPVKDNIHYGEAKVVVHPDFRRRGIGTALLREAESIAGANDRRTIGAGVVTALAAGDASHSRSGQLFLETSGFRRTLTEKMFRMDLTAFDPVVEQRLYDEAQAASTEYETVGWTGRIPEELLAPIAVMESTIYSEMPIGDADLEPENVDADRLRERDVFTEQAGVFQSGVIARLKGGTKIAAYTYVLMATEPGDSASQQITIVDPAHRGHRLGMRLKIENHRQLRRTRPALRWIYTGNADGNAPMLSINEKLGFAPVDAWYEYEKTLNRA